MKTFPAALLTVVSLVLSLGRPVLAASPGQANIVELWVRGTSPQVADDTPRARTQTIDLDELPLRTGSTLSIPSRAHIPQPAAAVAR